MEERQRQQNAAPGATVTVSFDAAGVLRGVRRALPIGLSVFSYGLVFGLLARQAGLDSLPAMFMSSTVFAGAAQFVVLDMWRDPLPVGALVLTTLIVNLRHLLMGAALSPWFRLLRPLKAYGSVFLMADENWALTMEEFSKGRTNAAFLVGSGLLIWLAWVAATGIGAGLGGYIGDPARWGLDFAFTAAFLALLAGLWRGKGDLPPWLVAAAVAVAAQHWLPGKWYILAGGLAGSLAGAFGRGD
jgi:4-azaleucine resistance transporter AzlC